MKDRLTDALKRSRSDYAEIRLEHTWSSSVAFRGRRLESATAAEDQGGFVRVLNHGYGWGIASFMSVDQLPRMIARADELSRLVRVEDIGILLQADAEFVRCGRQRKERGGRECGQSSCQSSQRRHMNPPC